MASTSSYDYVESDADYSIIDDSDDAALSVTSSTRRVPLPNQPVLSEVAGNNAASLPSPDDVVLPANINKTRGLRPRPTIDQSTFNHPSEEQENPRGKTPSETSSGRRQGLGTHALHALLSYDNDPPSDAVQLARHQEGKFSHVLTLPAIPAAAGGVAATEASGGQVAVKRVQCGCNVLLGDGTTKLGEHSNPSTATVTLLATVIDSSDEPGTDAAKPVAGTIVDLPNPAVAGPSGLAGLPRERERDRMGKLPGSSDTRWRERRKAKPASATAGEVSSERMQASTPPPAYPTVPGASATRPVRMSDMSFSTAEPEDSHTFTDYTSHSPGGSLDSRIEDSVEALDEPGELQEHIEAVTESAQLQLVTKKSAAVGTKPPGGGEATRRLTVAFPSQMKEETGKSSHTAASKRLSVVSRPASLAPPKPLVRSGKPLTVPDFALPGEKVSQQLKEKRLARESMTMPASSKTSSRTTSPTKLKTATSTKPPTQCELDMASMLLLRRQAEERRFKLMTEQEEERRRREFKARPAPASIAPGANFPRQTAASLARMTPKASTSRATRGSTMGPGKSSRPSLGGSSVSATSSAGRGRGNSTTLPPSAGLSRATSTSAGSARGSSVSAEDKREQKARGKEIFRRESSFVSDKERERRSRKEAVKQAREEAADRSRAWAQIQKKARSAGEST